MATVTHRVATPDTGALPNTSGAFTPSASDLLIVIFSTAGSVESPGNLTSSIGGFTFTQVQRQVFAGSTDALFLFVADALVSSATSQTVTTSPVDPGNGSNIWVLSIVGVTRFGLSAIRQSAGQTNGGAAATPAPAFGAAALTGNVCVGGVANGTNPAGMTQPASWTEAAADIGYTTPNQGLEVCFRNSGETGTTITWGSTSASGFASVIAEIDTTVLAAAPTPPRTQARYGW